MNVRDNNGSSCFTMVGKGKVARQASATMERKVIAKSHLNYPGEYDNMILLATSIFFSLFNFSCLCIVIDHGPHSSGKGDVDMEAGETLGVEFFVVGEMHGFGTSISEPSIRRHLPKRSSVDLFRIIALSAKESVLVAQCRSSATGISTRGVWVPASGNVSILSREDPLFLDLGSMEPPLVRLDLPFRVLPSWKNRSCPVLTCEPSC